MPFTASTHYEASSRGECVCPVYVSFGGIVNVSTLSSLAITILRIRTCTITAVALHLEYESDIQQ